MAFMACCKVTFTFMFTRFYKRICEIISLSLDSCTISCRYLSISEQTAIISLYSINLVGFITDTDSVYCAVRSDYLSAISG